MGNLSSLGLKLAILVVVLFLVPLYFLRGGPELEPAERGELPALVSERDRLIAQSDMVNGFMAVQDLRFRVQVYYDDRGELPLTLRDVGLTEAPVDQRGVVRSIRIEDYTVVADFNPNGHLPAGQLKLIPEADEQTGRLRWRCVTGDFKTISQIISTCKYRPGDS